MTLLSSNYSFFSSSGFATSDKISLSVISNILNVSSGSSVSMYSLAVISDGTKLPSHQLVLGMDHQHFSANKLDTKGRLACSLARGLNLINI